MTKPKPQKPETVEERLTAVEILLAEMVERHGVVEGIVTGTAMPSRPTPEPVDRDIELPKAPKRPREPGRGRPGWDRDKPGRKDRDA